MQPIQKIISIGAVILLFSTASAYIEPTDNDVIHWLEPKEYLVQVELHVEAYQDQYKAENQFTMNLTNTPLVFPVVSEGGYSELDEDRLNPRLMLDDHRAPTEFKIVPIGASGSALARFTIKKFQGKQIDIRLDEYITCYDAKVDEAKAMKIKWPEQWDPKVQEALQQQKYIESTSETIVRVQKKLVGDNAKKIPPYLLAKVLARGTVKLLQVSGTSISRDRRGKIDGLNVQGAEHAVTTRRGTLFDSVCLFVALCRASGLPARPVIGLDNEDNARVVAWAEFYLPDKGWIAVDIRELIAGPGMMRKLDRPWRGFGSNEDLNELVPIANYFHPPASVVGGGLKGKPMLWGWRPTPEHTPNNQRLRFTLQDAPQRGGAKSKKSRRGSGK